MTKTAPPSDFGTADDSGSVAEYLAALKGSPRFRPQVVHHEELASEPARYGSLRTPLPPELARALASQGISRLYRHQAAAIDRIRAGENVIVATPTASGKSLIYNLPVFEHLLAAPEARALYLFPLKALAQDQLRAIDELAAYLPASKRPSAAICDGDTSAYRRKKLREAPPRILITNPDMLHLSLLGYHESWAPFWASLSHVVIDEVHTYRGVFGSHMAWVLRRLRRLCRHHGQEPRFLLSSATVGNPGELAGDLLGTEAAVIAETGAPKGRRHFVFIDPTESAAFAASQLLEAALKRGLRTIVYTQSRKMTELVALWTQGRLGELAGKLTAYRSGFLPEDRREIEARLTSGELLGVVSTSALELGIDIGALDICILVGYPGTVMATWQRGGRVGRRQREALIILVGHEDALDQYFLRHPRDFFTRPVEPAVLNPENGAIAERHLLCAAAERPIPVADPLLAPEPVQKAVARMAARGDLLLGADGRQWFTGRKYPHREVDLRGSGSPFVIRAADEEGTVIGEIDGGRCFKECHPGAVYLHRGESWLVEELDLEAREVTVKAKKVPYFTRAMGSKETEILEVRSRVERAGFRAALATLRVTDTVTGFQKRLVKGQKLIGTVPLDLPPSVFETEGLWFEIDPALQQAIEADQVHFMGGIHAAEHACIGIFPLLVLCDRNDVGGISYPFHPQLNRAAVFIYDGYPGGVGLCRQAFARIEDLLRTARRTIASCPCELGCPSCVHSPKCGSGNRPIDKAAALRVLDGLLTGRGPKVGRFAKGRHPGEGRGPDHLDSGLRRNDGQMIPATFGKTMKAPAVRAAAGLPARYGVFDVETKRSAAEVGGWHLAERMGISVVVLYEAESDQYLVYREEEVGDFIARLRQLDLVVGFNNKRFDNLVLSAYTTFDLHSLPTLDILEVVKNRLGYRLTLDHLTEHTLGVRKSADGLQALQWYKEGRFDEIISYCREDVRITKELLLHGVEKGYLLFRNKAGHLVRCPVDFPGCIRP
ncbi:MAG: DEAD/DEAH box helicase [Desulfobacteraceae bacterium]|nr:DEAD/DEAH box helicase [Desulfobacteraceae bacterium]